MGIPVVMQRPAGASGPPPETLVRTAKGTWKWETQGEIPSFQTGNITLVAGESLVVVVANDDGAMTWPSSVRWNGSEMSFVVQQGTYLNTSFMSVYRLYSAAGGSGPVDLDFDTTESTPSVVLVTASSVTGLINAAHDKAASTRGNNNAPSSGATGALTQAHEIAFAFVLAECPQSDNTLNYAGIWTNGQRVGGSASVSGVLAEAYSVRNGTTAITASKTLSGTRQWAAICATFKAAA